MRPLHLAPELAPYQDEPQQLPSGSPGKVGKVSLRFARQGEKTVLAEMSRQAPLIVQRAIYWDEEMPGLPCIFIISNSGGILQGDRYTMEIELGPDSQAYVTTQSATKIQEMDANFASQEQEIVLGDHAYLEYLPDPMIPHKNSRFLMRTRIQIAPTATLLFAEIIMAGRKHYGPGELFEFEIFSSKLSAKRPDGRELFTEKYIIEPRRQDVRQVGIMNGFDVFGNVVLLAPKHCAERVFAEVPAAVNREEQWAAGASRLPHDAGLIYKIAGMETAPVRARIREFWSLVRQVVVGARVPAEFRWR